MHFTKYFSIVAFVATGVLASPLVDGKPKAPAPPPPPPPPPKPSPTTVSQTNACGNDATPYCCNTDSKGAYTSCTALAVGGGTCSATTVCCNANNSIQLCLGSAVITV